MRQIITDDYFRIALIIKEKDLQTFVKEKVEELKNIDNSGGDFGLALFIELMAYKKVREAIYEFLGPIFGVDDVGKMNFKDLWKSIQQLIQENDLKDFFSTVGRLLKIKSIS